jgi:hypothetical protein
MTSDTDGPEGNRVGKKLREAATFRQMAKIDARSGRTPVGAFAADRLEASARLKLREGLEVDGVGAGGEPVLLLPVGDGNDQQTRDLKNTVRDPDMVTASASLDRLRAAEAAGCLDVALDTADTIQPRNSMEMMLAHQAASAHQIAMRLAAISNNWMDRADPNVSIARPETKGPFMVEAVRAANASARLMAAYQDAMLALARVRGGGKQTVVVQHVQVNDGGRAVVAGKVGRGGRKRGGG